MIDFKLAQHRYNTVVKVNGSNQQDIISCIVGDVSK